MRNGKNLELFSDLGVWWVACERCGRKFARRSMLLNHAKLCYGQKISRSKPVEQLTFDFSATEGQLDRLSLARSQMIRILQYAIAKVTSVDVFAKFLRCEK